jgi:hypothetical protein
MSISFEKSFAAHAPAKTELISPDGKILLSAALALLAMTLGLAALLPVTADIAATFASLGL